MASGKGEGISNDEHGMFNDEGRATSAMISLSGHLPQGGDVEEFNYERPAYAQALRREQRFRLRPACGVTDPHISQNSCYERG